MTTATDRQRYAPRTPEFIRARGAMDMRLTTARDQFLSERKFGTASRRALSASTLLRYYKALSSFTDWMLVTTGKDSSLQFSADRVRAFVIHRDGLDRSKNTLHVECAALKEFAVWGAKKRYWTAEDIEDMPSVVRPNLLPRPMTPEQRDAIMTLPLDGQEAVLRALLYYIGGREFEIVALRLLDVTPPSALPTGETVPGQLRFFGKGRKERNVPIHPALWAVLGPHLGTLRGKPRDWPVLATERVTVGRGAKPAGEPWTRAMVGYRVRCWAQAAGIEHISPHVFRHTFATDALEATDNLRAVQELLGHANIATTAGYTKVVDRRRTAVVNALPTFPVHYSGSRDDGGGDATVT